MLKVRSYKIYDVDPELGQQFIASLEEHIAYVREAGQKLGVPEEQLLFHDASKYSHEELPFYARHFFGDGDPVGFAKAWLHHLHSNAHHWQYWIFPDGYSYQDQYPINQDGVLRMPQEYVLEMIADWMGASKAYTGSWDMTGWLLENIPKIIVHPDTAVDLKGILAELGYAGVVNQVDFQNK
jgi:hypothetical protein